MIASCADGTRTHNPRLLKHVLQFGSRSYFQGDEVVARGSVWESNPPTTIMVPQLHWTADVLQPAVANLFSIAQRRFAESFWLTAVRVGKHAADR
jgi:hypothetical protein